MKIKNKLTKVYYSDYWYYWYTLLVLLVLLVCPADGANVPAALERLHQAVRVKQVHARGGHFVGVVNDFQAHGTLESGLGVIMFL